LSSSALGFATRLTVLAFFDPPNKLAVLAPHLPNILFAGAGAGAGTPIVEGAGLERDDEFEGVVGVVGTDAELELAVEVEVETESRDGERKPFPVPFTVVADPFEAEYASSPAGNTVLYSFVNFECAALRAYMHWK
jgi:hypothetical protein